MEYSSQDAVSHLEDALTPGYLKARRSRQKGLLWSMRGAVRGASGYALIWAKFFVLFSLFWAKSYVERAIDDELSRTEVAGD